MGREYYIRKDGFYSRQGSFIKYFSLSIILLSLQDFEAYEIYNGR
jgi:hypothetical protein